MNCTECKHFVVKTSKKQVQYWKCKKTGINNISGKVFTELPEYCPINEGEEHEYINVQI